MFIFAELWPVSFANRPDSALYGAYASAADPFYPPQFYMSATWREKYHLS